MAAVSRSQDPDRHVAALRRWSERRNVAIDPFKRVPDQLQIRGCAGGALVAHIEESHPTPEERVERVGGRGRAGAHRQYVFIEHDDYWGVGRHALR